MLTPAKINLFLEVCGTRPDGYHTIRTIFAPLATLCDDVTVTPNSQGDLQFECSGRAIGLPVNGSNLCLKAAKSFLDFYGIKPAHTIRLIKNIPVSAGLGGGSSDAAAVLLCLCELHGILSTSSEIHTLAAALGADVAFFLQPQLASATGRGEFISPIIGPTLRPIISLYRRAVVVYPRFPSPVATAYRLADNYAHACSPSFEQTIEAIQQGTFSSRMLRNDLESGLFPKFSFLELLRDSLLESGTERPLLSGSGSSMFALLPEDFSSKQEQALIEKMAHFKTEVFFCDL